MMGANLSNVGQPNFPRFLGKTQMYVNMLPTKPSTFAVISFYVGISIQSFAKDKKINSSDIFLGR